MPASGYSITGITDIPLGSSVDNVIANKPGVKVRRASRVKIFLTRETTDVNADVTVGGTNVFPAGPCNISTVIGSIPSTDDDEVIETLAGAGDEIIIAGTNADGAEARELRALVKVMPIAPGTVRTEI